MSHFYKIEGRPDLVRDPHSKAILNCNYEKLNNSKNMKELNNKYNMMKQEITEIKNNISDIKELLLKLNKEENNNG